VGRREGFEDFFPSRGEMEMYLATIFDGDITDDQLIQGEAIDEAYRAVMAYLQTLRQFPDRDVVPPWETFDGEQGLVLFRGEAGRCRSVFAEPKEFPQLVSKGREALILQFGQRSTISHERTST